MKEPEQSCPLIDTMITHLRNQVDLIRDVINHCEINSEVENKLVRIGMDIEALYEGDKPAFEALRNLNFNIRKWSNEILINNEKIQSKS